MKRPPNIAVAGPLALALLLAAAHLVCAASRRTPIVAAVQSARLSVVNISTERVVLQRYKDPFFGFEHDFFDRRFEEFFQPHAFGAKKVETPLGSGVIIDQAGFVVTNEHVIRRASNIILSIPQRKPRRATLLCADPANDIALLQIEGGGSFAPVRFGRSDDLMLGETVIALGNPYGFANSVTSGIVSALDREVSIGRGPKSTKYRDLIQTSALINPGNSGGPLVNLNGELIGINTAIVERAQGIGFAIPVDRLKQVLARLMARPPVAAGWLGLQLQSSAGPRAPLQLSGVDPESPAARARLRPADVITHLDGRPVADAFGLRLRLARKSPGDPVRLSVRRHNRAMHVAVRLASPPEVPPRKVLHQRMGLSGQDHTKALARHLSLVWIEGVLISSVTAGGPAARVGLRANDIIVQLGAHRVRHLRDAAQVLQHSKAGERIFVQIVRRDYRAYTRILLQ